MNHIEQASKHLLFETIVVISMRRLIDAKTPEVTINTLDRHIDEFVALITGHIDNSLLTDAEVYRKEANKLLQESYPQHLMDAIDKHRPRLEECIQRIDKYLSQQKNAPSQREKESKRSRTSEAPEEYSSLEQLFTSSNDFSKYIDVLRGYEIPTINESGEWIGKNGSRSVLVAWIDRLERKGHLKPIRDRKNLIPLLTAYFSGLTIGRRTLYEQPKADVAQKLKDYFTSKIPH